ncbi:MAG: helix-turn-helix transcriptional regulator [Planctomycetia bacterium]|nr:helix-turn-helix transcriptional regulator [Planctomycetia bacterium]
MGKSIYTAEQRVLLAVLRDTRLAAKKTQAELAKALGRTQSEVSKWERGETRLDLVQLRGICHALGTTLPAFVGEYERRLGKGGGRKS